MKELTIVPPEGYEIDKEHSTFEKIMFKPIDSKPRSWEELSKQVKGKYYYYISSTGNICRDKVLGATLDRNSLPSEELANAFRALMQLMSLRQAWIGEWKPDWNYGSSEKHCIYYNGTRGIVIGSVWNTNCPLSFPTYEMAEEFFNCFKYLIEQAKILL